MSEKPTTKTFGKSSREVPASSEKAKKWYNAEDDAENKKVSLLLERYSIYTLIATRFGSRVGGKEKDAFAWGRRHCYVDSGRVSFGNTAVFEIHNILISTTQQFAKHRTLDTGDAILSPLHRQIRIITVRIIA